MNAPPDGRADVLTARQRLAAPDRRRVGAVWAVAVPVSAALHVAVLVLLLPRAARVLPPSIPPLEVEMVQQQAETPGAPNPGRAAPAPAPPTPAAAAAPSDTPPLPPAPSAPAKTAASAPAAPSRPSESPARAEVNLGSGLQDVDPLEVSGDHIVPAAPDARYRNQPPHYPAAAARIGADGTVALVVHVGADGRALGVDVDHSSGNLDLDREAQRAVSRWHFQPARRGGQPVPYDYAINIRFALGNH